jgi:SlyX protein
MNDIERRLTELEIKAGFTEDLVDTLNATVARQQEAIEMLVREIARLRELQASGAGASSGSLRDELPPHY